MTKLHCVYKSIAKLIVGLAIVGATVFTIVALVGCSSPSPTDELPIPTPVSDYKSQICGVWEGINSKNIDHGLRFDFKPNYNVYISIKQNDEYVPVTAATGTYDIYDNKILYMLWNIKKGDADPVVSEEFWHITITGKVMYLSVKRMSKDGESYVVTLTMKKIK